MRTKVFIDGEHGTTGLQIRKRLASRDDLEILSIPLEDRHNDAARFERLNEADIAILCLPDDAAIATVNAVAENHKLRIIDSSTAHRISPQWVYGFAELTEGQAERIGSARFVANPGCYPTGALSIIRPLREANLIDENFPVSINAVSGYTGGGKKMISQMENQNGDDRITANYFLYGLNLRHKHVPEIRVHGKLAKTPLFVPSVGRFPQGMIVNIPLHNSLLKKHVTGNDLRTIFNDHYRHSKLISVATEEENNRLVRLDAELLANTDKLKIFVFGDDAAGIYNISAVLDNLGKGASGAAVQNLDLMIGKS
ncbi:MULTISPECIES: N-acetyl-gamma-glutamyl-phosphate reductase [Bartonella]|uniref:N-acetyl-gamma-glutamyl-phosphate reductase n=1 Tax=Bartonella TaxID=773 RepID=UPI0018DE31FE|nr:MULTISPECIES: N-acetyl-gamma-glutamyl-phosphate reductase [Bartonella]MBH9975319.1 N-acetyl-gamma-glutamyl-phosphate reductase [Bartonella choladocola]MBI0014926.1 N-acetyl-gamma-glutamyl-phosphate reductase [Bartonella sp. B10834G3]